MAADLTLFDHQTSGTRIHRGRRCGVSLWCNPRQSERKRRSRTAGSPRRQSRVLMHIAVAAAAAPSVAIRARASESGGREPQVRPAASRERSKHD